MVVSSHTLMPRYACWLKRLRGSPVTLSQGCCQGTVPCASRARMRSVMTWYGVSICAVGIGKTSMVVKVMSLAGGEHEAPTRLSVVQELVRPALERGRRRGRLLIAEQAVHHVVWDSGPADELRLERRDRGNGLWCGTDPQEACVRILLDRRIKHLCEERHQGIIPTDDHRQVRVLSRDAVATHPYLWGCGW